MLAARDGHDRSPAQRSATTPTDTSTTSTTPAAPAPVSIATWAARQDALCRQTTTARRTAASSRLGAARAGDDAALRQAGADVGAALRRISQDVGATPLPDADTAAAQAFADGRQLELAQLVRTYAVDETGRPAALELAHATATKLDPFVRAHDMPACDSTAGAAPAAR